MYDDLVSGRKRDDVLAKFVMLARKFWSVVHSKHDPTAEP
jgi:hypothetical protein